MPTVLPGGQSILHIAQQVVVQEALKTRADYADAYTGLGTALKDSGRKSEAIACFQRVCSLKPHCALSHGNLAGQPGISRL